MRIRKILPLFAALFALSGCGINTAEYESSSSYIPYSESSSSSSSSSSSHSEHDYRLIRVNNGNDGLKDKVSIYGCYDCNVTKCEYEESIGYSNYYMNITNNEVVLNSVNICIPANFKGDITIPDVDINNAPIVGINDYAFSGNGSNYIKSINLGKNIYEIPDGTFRYCSNLETITVDPDNPYYSSLGGVLYNKDQTLLIAYPAHKEDSVFIIPDTVTEIAPYAFSNSDVATVVFPSNLSAIRDNAFEYSYNLCSLDFRDTSLYSIGRYAFYCCYNLLKVYTNNTIYDYNIGDYAFDSCYKLIEVYELSNNITGLYTDSTSCGRLAYYARWVHTSDLESSYLYTLNDLVCYDEPMAVCIVAKSSDAMDVTDINLDSFNTYRICDYAFYQSNIESLNFLNVNITQIGNYAFKGSNVKSFYANSFLSYIGYGAFANCYNLYSVTFVDFNKLNDLLFQDRAIFLDCYHLVLVQLGNSDVIEHDYLGRSDVYNALFTYAVAINNSSTIEGFTQRIGPIDYIVVDDLYNVVRFNHDILSFYTETEVSINAILPYAFYKEDANYYGSFRLSSSTPINTISRNAFNGCVFNELTIDADVNTIENSAFKEASIKRLHLTGHIDNIQREAFANSRITNFIIDGEIETIGDEAFSYLSYTRSIIFNGEFNSNVYRMFNNSSIGEIRLPNGMTDIYKKTFENMSYCTRIIIPSSVTSIENNALSKISYLFCLATYESSATRSYRDNGGSRVFYIYSSIETTSSNYWHYEDNYDYPELWSDYLANYYI